MNLTFQLLKKYFPELNKKVIGKERVIEVLGNLNIPVFEINMSGRGAYVRDASDGREYVFIRYNLQNLFFHETLCFEGVHALAHVPCHFLKRRHELQSEIFSLIFMMPAADLPRLNSVKHQLEAESYHFLIRRNEVRARWNL